MKLVHVSAASLSKLLNYIAFHKRLKKKILKTKLYFGGLFKAKWGTKSIVFIPIEQTTNGTTAFFSWKNKYFLVDDLDGLRQIEQLTEKKTVVDQDQIKQLFKLVNNYKLKYSLKPILKKDIQAILATLLTEPKKTTARISELEKIIKKANRDYYNSGKSSLTDDQYDAYKDELESLDPKNPLLDQVGASVDSTDKETLPMPMGSLNKVKPDGSLNVWKKTIPTGATTVVSVKEDGVSGQVVYENGDLDKAFTRGDGFEGQPILFKAKLNKDIPNSIKTKASTKIRGEFVLDDAIFDKKYSKKFGGKFRNPRNLVAGALRRSNNVNKELLKDIEFLAYEIMGSKLNKQQQLNQLKAWGFKVVKHWVLPLSKVTEDNMTKLLTGTRKAHPRYMDGLVIELDDHKHRSKLGLESNGLNPAFARAFKTSDKDSAVQATVKEVKAGISKRGLLKPRVQINPVDLGGVTVTYATGHNFGYIRDNKIGKGAKIDIIRSGDVIPYILGVKKGAKADIPEKCPYCSSTTEWVLPKKIDLSCPNQVCPGRISKNITNFFTKIGVRDLKQSRIKLFEEHGYESVDDIIRMTVKDLKKLPGMQDRMATKLHEGIHKALGKLTLPQLMNASGYFSTKTSSLGERLLEKLVAEYGDILKWSGLKPKAVYAKIVNDTIADFSNIRKKIFARGLPPFLKWYKANSKFISFVKKAKPKGSKLQGVQIVYTGFRNRAEEDRIVENGGTLGSAVSSKTTVLVVKDISKGSTKTKKAQELGVKVLSPSQFNKWLDRKLGK